MKRRLIKIIDFFRYDLPRGIKNLIRWFPVIWKDRDWDWYFLVALMAKKLKQMEDFQFWSGHSVGHKKISHRIKIARILCERIMNDDYLENALRPHEKKYGELQLKFKPYKDDLSEMYTRFKNCPIELKEQADKEWKRYAEHGHYMEEQDVKFLCEYLKHYIKFFWD